MSIQRQETKQRMSRIVIHNDTVYLCGQVGKDANQGITEQTATMLEKVDELLLQAGSDRQHMLSATVYVRDMKDFAAMNEVWDAWVQKGMLQRGPVWKRAWHGLSSLWRSPW